MTGSNAKPVYSFSGGLITKLETDPHLNWHSFMDSYALISGELMSGHCSSGQVFVSSNLRSSVRIPPGNKGKHYRKCDCCKTKLKGLASTKQQSQELCWLFECICKSPPQGGHVCNETLAIILLTWLSLKFVKPSCSNPEFGLGYLQTIFYQWALLY